MAIRLLLRTDSKLSLKFLCNSGFANPQFTAPILQTNTVNEALQLHLNQNLQLLEFLGMSQKLVTEEASSINARECFNGCVVADLAARGRGPSRQRIDTEDDEDVDEDDKFEDFDEDDLNDDFEDDDEDFEDEDDDYEDDDNKFNRKKK